MPIAELSDQINAIRHRARQLLNGLTTDQLTRRPDPARWSVGECIAHLNLVTADYCPLIKAAIADAQKNNLAGKGHFNPGILGKMFIKSMEPPVKRRFKAVSRLANPVAVGDPAKLLEEFLKWQDEVEALTAQSEPLNQEKIRIQSPYARWMRLRLCAVFPFILAHERRHLSQAEQVKRAIAPGVTSGVVHCQETP